MISNELRTIPSVERLLCTSQAKMLIREFGRLLTLETIRLVLAEIRAGLSAGDSIPAEAAIFIQVAGRLAELTHANLMPVINATGVILHTNLGRSPLSAAAVQAIQSVAQSYSNLEYDLEEGERSPRMVQAEKQLTQFTGAEAALVVNNNAAGSAFCSNMPSHTI